MPLPVGLAYDPAQRVVLDPDKQLQSTLRHFFETFRRTGAAWATVQAFAKEGLKFPRHRAGGFWPTELANAMPQRCAGYVAQSALRRGVLFWKNSFLEKFPWP